MNIRTTTDPISQHEVHDPEHHPYLLVVDGMNEMEIYFETEKNRQIYLDMEVMDYKVVAGSDSEDYVAHG